MFDHTITDLPFTHPLFDFVRNGLSGENDAANSLFTLPYQMERLGHLDNDNLALKIDVEGAEFDAISSVPSSRLRQFRQFVLEIHGLSRLSEPGYRTKFVDMLVCINSAFTLYHVHGNNCAPLAYVDGYLVADVLELTYVRSDLVVAEPSTTIFPTSLDYANSDWASDILLWFFPFLPINVGQSASTVDQAFRLSLKYSDQALRSYRASILEEKLAALTQESSALKSALAELNSLN